MSVPVAATVLCDCSIDQYGLKADARMQHAVYLHEREHYMTHFLHVEEETLLTMASMPSFLLVLFWWNIGGFTEHYVFGKANQWVWSGMVLFLASFLIYAWKRLVFPRWLWLLAGVRTLCVRFMPTPHMEFFLNDYELSEFMPTVCQRCAGQNRWREAAVLKRWKGRLQAQAEDVLVQQAIAAAASNNSRNLGGRFHQRMDRQSRR
jgi:hypothetical protein